MGKLKKSPHRTAQSTRTADLARPIEVIARGLAVVAGHVLLCKADKGYLYLPGGHVEHGESAASALRREFLEECGWTITVGELGLASECTFVAGKKQTPHHEILLVFHVELATPPAGRQRAARAGKRATTRPALPNVRSLEPEISFEWVPLPVVQDLDVRPDVHRAWLSTLGASGTVERPPPPEWISAINPSPTR